jgi:hypothetical protein
MSAKIGDHNRNGQILIEKTSKPGNHPYATTWRLRCHEKQRHKDGADFEYNANSCDFHIRKCPKCDPSAARGI